MTGGSCEYDHNVGDGCYPHWYAVGTDWFLAIGLAVALIGEIAVWQSNRRHHLRPGRPLRLPPGPHDDQTAARYIRARVRVLPSGPTAWPHGVAAAEQHAASINERAAGMDVRPLLRELGIPATPPS